MQKLAYILLFLSVPLICIAVGRELYQSKSTTQQTYTVYEQPITAIPVAINNPTETAVSVSAGSYIVLDVSSSVVLAEKNADSLFFPASTAKMMTAITASQNYRKDEVIPISFNILGLGEKVLFSAGSHFTAGDLIKAALIQSHNAAALALAQADPYGQNHFVMHMNTKAAELHLTNTRFENPVGFDSEYMQSTARDLAFLAKELIKDPFLRETVATQQATITDVVTNRQYTVHNTNGLLGYNDQVFGIKTGTTDMAGQVLVTLAKVDDHEVIIVVLESVDRYADTKALLQWLDTKVQWYTVNDLM